MASDARRFALALPFFAALAVAGCRKDEPRPAPATERYNDLPQAPAAGEVTNPVGDTRVRPYASQVSPFPAEAAERITAERCAREIRCNNVGAGKKYSDLSACMADLGSKSKAELNAYECSGVNQKEVEQCLAEIRADGCGSALGALERMAACRSGLLCLPR